MRSTEYFRIANQLSPCKLNDWQLCISSLCIFDSRKSELATRIFRRDFEIGIFAQSRTFDQKKHLISWNNDVDSRSWVRYAFRASCNYFAGKGRRVTHLSTKETCARNIFKNFEEVSGTWTRSSSPRQTEDKRDEILAARYIEYYNENRRKSKFSENRCLIWKYSSSVGFNFRSASAILLLFLYFHFFFFSQRYQNIVTKNAVVLNARV